MIGAILSFFTWLLGRLFGKPAGPSQEAVATKAEGVAETNAAASAQVAKTETAVAQAEADAPRTQAAVVDSMDKGTF